MNATSPVGALTEKLGVLQRELETLGFSLDSRGNREATDVALAVSARIEELRQGCGVAAGPLNLHETSL